MKPANNHQFFLLDAEKTYQDPVPFLMQPIMHAADELVAGFEILYRGPVPRDWLSIDRSVVAHLCNCPADSLPVFFVNLCHQAFVDIPDSQLIEASRRHRTVFELSRPAQDAAMAAAMTQRISRLAAQGVRFAQDDFGSDGRPDAGMLDGVAAIKIDGALIRQAIDHRHAADALGQLVARWRAAQIVSIAECIESPAMLACARELKIDFVQGFHVDTMVNGLDAQDLSRAG